MRLICGVLRLDGAHAGQDQLRAMAAQMAAPHLRPSLILWNSGPVGLAILDFAIGSGSPPALPETDTAVLAADVRLDEPAALAHMLGRNAPRAEDALLLALLERFGTSTLPRVLGDFAFAGWNRTTQRLTCGRDVFGVRPLSYAYQAGKLFAFASLPNALHGGEIVAKRIDEDAFARRLTRSLRGDDSLIVGIKRLPPAHVIEVSGEAITISRYWQLDRAAAGTRPCAAEEAARELRRLLEQAVRCRLPRTGEVGAHLSGGLDSSAVAVLAARQLREQGRQLHAYSWLDRQRNDVALEDETGFVKALLDQEGDIGWTPIRAPAAILARGEAMDADTMALLDADTHEHMTCARAEAQGVALVLQGWGGDQSASFDGRGTLAELFLRGRWRTLAREVAALSREHGKPGLRIFRGEVLSYLARAWLPDTVFRLVEAAKGKPKDHRTLFRESLSTATRRRLATSRGRTLNMTSNACENRWRLLTAPHLAECLEAQAQIGAGHGLAFAFPLLDRRLVEFVLSLPSELFLRGGFRRRLFRDAMTDVLPPAVRLRHRKYLPFPGRMIDLAEMKNQLLARIDAYEKNDTVRRTMNLGHLRRLVEAFPSPERVREETRGNDQPAAAGMMNATVQALAAAAYLEQHGNG